MGIETDLVSTQGYEYSIQDGPWQPYNPALILGGLETGVTPLEMAHAYNTLAAGGSGSPGTMAANSGGPVGILDVTDGGDCENDCYQSGDPVPDQTGASGVNKLVAKAGDRPDRRRDRQGCALDRGQLRVPAAGPRTATRPGARPAPPTTTATPGSAARRPKITACIWVGYRDTVTPMETEFAGGPVDGGTFPALIFSQIAAAYEAVQADAQPATRPARRVDDRRPTTTTAPASPAHRLGRPPPTESVADRRRPRPRPDQSAPAAPAATGGGGYRRRRHRAGAGPAAASRAG